MKKALNTQSAQTSVTYQEVSTQPQEPKRLSKAAIWRQNTPGGIGVIIDRRAVNR